MTPHFSFIEAAFAVERGVVRVEVGVVVGADRFVDGLLNESVGEAEAFVGQAVVAESLLQLEQAENVL